MSAPPNRVPSARRVGFACRAPYDPALIERADTVIVPGWRDPAESPARPLLETPERVGARGGRLVSVCSGAFVLAAAGLLNGRRAATHRRYAELLAHRYQDIRADPDVLHVDEGDVLTSAGSAAGFDLCLHIVRRDHGGVVANNVARRLLLAPTAGAASGSSSTRQSRRPRPAAGWPHYSTGFPTTSTRI